uniref:Protein O-GlcNAcase n=1 Tax=Periophthalmus magnuspinnatus TaxID=409849 RepID=A0A3B4B7U3_9GOBI
MVNSGNKAATKPQQTAAYQHNQNTTAPHIHTKDPTKDDPSSVTTYQSPPSSATTTTEEIKPAANVLTSVSQNAAASTETKAKVNPTDAMPKSSEPCGQNSSSPVTHLKLVNQSSSGKAEESPAVKPLEAKRFYGRPWTMEQRKELFRRYQKWGLNTYLYAPKDDYKHRMFWRELYSVEEAEQLMTLIGSAKEHGIEFIYAISPGLDITFSNQKEVSALKRKLDQVTHFGCKSFALLFDDIDHNMCPADKEVFSSFAHAQVSITNEIYQYLGEPQTFLFCPTEYCGTFCYPNVSQSPYLHTVGEKLLPGIDVLWTADGEESTVSIQIKLENEGSDEELETDMLYSPQLALKLALTEWLGEFCVPHQYNSRQVPQSGAKSATIDISSLAAPSLCSSTTVTTVFQQPIMSPAIPPLCLDPLSLPMTKETEDEKKEPEEEPMEMVVEKQDEALPEVQADSEDKQVSPIQTEKMTEDLKPMDTDKESLTESKSPEESIQEDSGSDIAPMQTDEQLKQDIFVPGPNEKPLFTAEPLTIEDLGLLAELFYLPYEHGPKAMQMLKEFNWLRANSSVVSVNCKRKDDEKVTEWKTRAEKFEEMCCSVIHMFTRLSNSVNRTILYDLYPYIWDIKSIISMVKSFVQWLGCRSQSSAQFLKGDQEPWAFRGGLAGEFQRLLPIDGANDLFYQPPPSLPTSKIYSIRPYYPKDEAAVYKICKEMYFEGMDDPFSDQEPDLIGDRLVGGLLTLSSDYGFVLEDEEGICGYAVGTVDVKPFVKKCKLSWLPFMQEKYHKPDIEKDLSEEQKMMLSFHEEEEGLPDSFLSNFPSLIKVDIHAKVTDPSVAKSMMGCLLSSLKANGSHGAFCKVRQSDKRMLDFYSKLGCFEVAKMDGFPKDVIIMGRSL